MSLRRQDPLSESPTTYVGDDFYTSLRRIVFYQLPLVLASLWSLQTHRIWPVLPLGLGLSLLVLLVDRYSLEEQSVVFAAMLSGILYRGTVAVATPSLIGYDPDNHVVAILRINETGTLSSISPLIYEHIPLFFSYHSVTTQLTGTEPTVSLNLATLILYTVIPVAVVASVLRRVSDTNTVKMGSILTTGGTIFLTFSGVPITQGFMNLFWFILMITLFDIEDDSRLTLAAVVIFLMTLSHKLGALLPLLLTGCMVVFTAVQSWRRNEFTVPRRLIVLTVYSVVMLLFQSFVLTGYGSVIIKKLTQYGDSPTPGVSSPAGGSIAPFVEPVTGVGAILFEHASWLVVIPLAGLAGAWILYSETDERSAKILAIAITCVAFVVVAITSTVTLAGVRARILGGPIYMVLVAIGAGKLIGRGERPPVGTAVILLLLVTQLGASGAAPDHPTENVQYLSEPEVDAREHANSYIDGQRWAPSFVAQAAVNYSRPELTHVTGKGLTPGGWTSMDVYLLFGQVPDDGCIVWRKELRYLRVGDLFRITDDPTPLFEQNRSRVYENEDIVMYC